MTAMLASWNAAGLYCVCYILGSRISRSRLRFNQCSSRILRTLAQSMTACLRGPHELDIRVMNKTSPHRVSPATDGPLCEA